MFKEFKDHSLGGVFRISDENERSFNHEVEALNLMQIVWNKNEEPIQLQVDGVEITLKKDQLTTLTYLKKVEIPRFSEPIFTFSFNRAFYCIHDHDNEVSCNGIIFFGAQDIPIISLSEEEKRKFNTLFEVFLDEFTTQDNVQGEMLEMLLKRLIIKTTRLAKDQNMTRELDNSQVDIIRKFNTLVDFNYKEKKLVSDYADMLYRSPKTLSNLFAKYNQKTPLAIIHERIILEAKRLLLFTDFTAKEIAYELGFEEVASFHKIFKKITQTTPNQFKIDMKKAA
ncbi:MAG: helix-turn-helix domain-containing protein [Bacteroidota bacterium]